MDIILQELAGIHGNRVLRDMNDTIKMYEAYEGNLTWENELGEIDYIPTRKKNNYIKLLMKKQARFFLGKTPDFNIITENDNTVYKEFLEKVLDNNLFKDKLIKGARDCFIGKRVAIKLNIIKGDKVSISFVPSLEFVYEADEEDLSELKKIIFFYTTKDSDNKAEQRIWKQKYEMINGKCYLTEGVYDGYGSLIELHYDEADTKLDFIPAYVIINDDLSGGDGESDVRDLIDNQLQINRIASEDIDTLLKGMNEILWGANLDAKSVRNLKIAPGVFWDVMTDPVAGNNGAQAQVGTLSKTFAYDTRIENALNRMKSEMFEALSIPETNLDDLQGVLSGKAMRTLYWGLIERCEEKWCQWEPALTWMVYAIIEIAKIYGLLADNGDYKVEVLNNYPIPEDREDELISDLNQVNSDTMSRLSFYKKWRNNDDKEAMEEIKQIALEKRMLEESFGFDIDNNDDEGDDE